MSRQDETLAAASTVLRGLARGAVPATPNEKGALNGLHLPPYDLPGRDSTAKQELEAELTALARRISYLEARAELVGKNLPDTPGEFQSPASPLVRSVENGSEPNPMRTERQASVTSRSRRVNNLLAARELDVDRTVSEEDISVLRDHVEKQSEQIRSQRETITEISRGLRHSEEQAKQAFQRVENEDVGMLERELRKHQQANEAFQKALREIGGIVTQVARGNLSNRVQIQATEMDDEIATFKKTINTMMDQLELFGSEVSRMAREVGTEGILGGQAQVKDVQGIWKELTVNGECTVYSLKSLLTIYSQRDGCKFDSTSARNRNSHESGRSR